MEEVTTNMIIAVIVNYLVCREIKYLLRKEKLFVFAKSISNHSYPRPAGRGSCLLALCQSHEVRSFRRP